ncbi:MAG: LytR C-terminal domain-containing protein [Patescibacteria group bacterium]|nr:LytR C-terminal domain-containing protein [Patescibacteria group bacterium]MCL5095454.1 LytR C-terminal domain-containing protein [Patescibacteria group bacterium]
MKRLPRWRQEQRNKRRRKVSVLIKLVFCLILLGFILFLAFSFLKLTKESPFNKDSRSTIILATKPLLLLSFEPGSDLTVISIPEKTYLEVNRGFGSYRLGAVWELGAMEGLRGKLLAETVGEFLGVPVDGWVGPKNGSWSVSFNRENFLQQKNELISLRYLLKPQELILSFQNLETNLNFVDLTRLWFSAKFTRFDKVKFVDLENGPALNTLTLADGTKVLTADQKLVDSLLVGLFKEQKIVQEHLTVEILNGTEKAGLANRLARLITNLGGDVVSVTNSQEKISRCQIKGKSQALESYTGQLLFKIYNCVKIADQNEARADLQVAIGQDYWQKLFERD